MHIITHSKSDCLFNTQSIVLQAYWLIMENNEKAILSVKMPFYRFLRLRHKVSTTASCKENELRNLLANIEYWANGIYKLNVVCTKYFAMTLENQWQASTIKCHWFAQMESLFIPFCMTQYNNTHSRTKNHRGKISLYFSRALKNSSYTCSFISHCGMSTDDSTLFGVACFWLKTVGKPIYKKAYTCTG